MKNRKLLTWLIASAGILTLCIIFVINITPQGDALIVKPQQGEPLVVALPPLDPATSVCSFTQSELDDLLTKLNELYNNMIILAQIIQGAPNQAPTKDLETLMLNANMPQDASRTCKAFLERFDYTRRLSITLASNIFYAVPSSAEKSANKTTIV